MTASRQRRIQTLTHWSWRRKAAAAGLLIDLRDALPGLRGEGKGLGQQPMAPQDWGVSLEWLEAFVGVLTSFEGADQMSTAEIVARLVSPACTLRSHGEQTPISPAGVTPLPQRAATHSTSGGSHDAADTSSDEEAPAERHSPKRRMSRSEDKALCFLPKEVHVRLLDLVPAKWTGPPQLYIIHAWQGNLLECLRAIIRQGRAMAAPHAYHVPTEDVPEKHDMPPTGGRASDSGSRVLPTVYVWLDWVVLLQQAWMAPAGGHSSCAEVGSGLQMWGPPAQRVDVEHAREVIASCALGALVVLDRDMVVLSRTWPLFEAWAADYFSQTASTGGSAALLVTLVSDVPAASLLAMRDACARLDMTRSTCTRPEDKQRIIGVMKATSGVKRAQDNLTIALLAGVRTALRWSGRVEDMAVFCVLLLQNGDYAQLQYLLHGMPGLADDEATLKDIRAIFQMYDADGTGELELDEFTAVLALAGFGQEEARRIFSEVDKDNGGSVCLEEFESWWIESQLQAAHAMRPAVQLTLGALVANLRALTSLLERKDLHTAADLVSQYVTNLEAQGVGGSRSSETPLPPFCMRGDYLAVADQVVFKIMSGQLRSALQLVLSLLRTNGDALALEQPPEQILPQNALIGGLPTPVLRAALAWSMALVAELLGRNPGRLREAEHFAREALELAAQGLEEAGLQTGMPHVLHHNQPKKHRKAAPKARMQKDRDAIVTSMVRLKYGKDTLISHRLIAEASISLSTWMASSKSSGNAHKMASSKDKSNRNKMGAAAADAAQGVTQFATAYLGGGGASASTRDGSQGSLGKDSKLPMPLLDLSRVLLASYQTAIEQHPPGQKEIKPRSGRRGHKGAAKQLKLDIDDDMGEDEELQDSSGISPIPDPTAPPAHETSGHQQMTIHAHGGDPAQSAYKATQMEAPRDADDANIERLVRISRSGLDGAQDNGPRVPHLGARLERVMTIQLKRRNGWSPPSSPTKGTSSLAGLLANGSGSFLPQLVSPTPGEPELSILAHAPFKRGHGDVGSLSMKSRHGENANSIPPPEQRSNSGIERSMGSHSGLQSWGGLDPSNTRPYADGARTTPAQERHFNYATGTERRGSQSSKLPPAAQKGSGGSFLLGGRGTSFSSSIAGLMLRGVPDLVPDSKKGSTTALEHALVRTAGRSRSPAIASMKPGHAGLHSDDDKLAQHLARFALPPLVQTTEDVTQSAITGDC